MPMVLARWLPVEWGCKSWAPACLVVLLGLAWKHRAQRQARRRARQGRVAVRPDEKDQLILWAPPNSPGSKFPHGSPFVVKLDCLLKVAGLDYKWIEPQRFDFGKAPNGKMPCLLYNGALIEDTRLIVDWLEDHFKVNLDRGLTTEQRAVSHGFVRMLEESTYFQLVYTRWQTEGGFASYTRDAFFGRMPFLLRLFVPHLVRKRFLKYLYGQGTGRLTEAEAVGLARKDFQALHDYLELTRQKHPRATTFFNTPSPTLLDVVAFGQLGAIHMVPELKSELRAALREFPLLIELVESMARTFYPELYQKFVADRG